MALMKMEVTLVNGLAILDLGMYLIVPSKHLCLQKGEGHTTDRRRQRALDQGLTPQRQTLVRNFIYLYMS